LNHTWRSNKLNFAYASGGTELLRKEISNLLGIPVDFHVTVDLKGFISLVDQIGGVDFDVPVNMDYDDPYQDLHIHYAKGMRHLNGQQAMEVVRWRKNNDGTGYATADIGRIGTQQAFLTQVARQLLSVKNVPAMAEVFLKYVKTDLKLGNLVWLGNEALDIGMEGVSFYTLPGDGSGWYKGESVYALDPEATLALVNEALNPYVDPIAMEDMDICIP
ncbi:MAG: LCP family protein, partial [Oscillospiraceae bacterium]|nr:LCP family protein [Oscillospiraceae bacterium]